MNKIILLLILYIVPICASSQNFHNTIFKEIQEKRDSLTILIAENKIQSIEIEKVKVKGAFSVVTIYEKEKLLLLSESFYDFLEFFNKNEKNTVLRANSRFIKYREQKQINEYKFARYFVDSLSTQINKYLTSTKKQFQLKLRQSDLTIEEQEFIKLIHLYLILTTDYCDIGIEEELLKDSRLFLHNYPKSMYSAYVLKYFNIEFRKSKWGAGVYFNTGMIIPSGNLSGYISPGIPLNIGLTLNYDRVYFFFGYGAGIGSNIKRDLYYQKQWLSGDKLVYAMGELNLGYNIINREKFGVTTFTGFGGAGLSPYSKDEPEYYDDVENITPHNYFAYGVNFDYRWAKTNCKSSPLYGRGAGRDYGYIITRLSIGYSNPKYEKKVDGLDGGIWFLKIGIGYQYQLKRKVKTGYNIK